jgi:hypothetical protein
MKIWIAGSIAALLVGCGGGGGGDRAGSSYTVYAQTPEGFPYSVCIDGIDPPNPESPQGRQVTNVLLDYYDLVRLREVVVSFELSCLESDPGVNEIVTLSEYNNIILPTVLGTTPPAKEPLASSL